MNRIPTTPAALRTRYGLGPHDLSRDPGDLADLVNAVERVAGVKIAAIAEAIGCSHSLLCRRLREAGAGRKQRRSSAAGRPGSPPPSPGPRSR